MTNEYFEGLLRYLNSHKGNEFHLSKMID